ncbi:MAG: hypothetical protein MZV70_18170 [Desulfobacterales bacterium]|nr:hypothetical protein [Desulfobacterales bacterium]
MIDGAEHSASGRLDRSGARCESSLCDPDRDRDIDACDITRFSWTSADAAAWWSAAAAVGTRKVETLLACGARVTVVSPEVTDELRGLAARRRHHAAGSGTMPPRTWRACFW